MNVIPMLRLFQAGVIAGCVQCIVTIVLSPLVVFHAQNQIETLNVPNHETLVPHTTSLLKLVYLLTAIGLASTKHRFVDCTAMRMRAASRIMHPTGPDRAIDALLVCLWITATAFAALTLGSPPGFLTEFDWHFGAFDAAPIIWSGIMSVGVAAFGANAHAAVQASREAHH